MLFLNTTEYLRATISANVVRENIRAPFNGAKKRWERNAYGGKLNDVYATLKFDNVAGDELSKPRVITNSTIRSSP